MTKRVPETDTEPEKRLIKAAGLRLTRPRELILARLRSEHGPFQVKDLYEGLPRGVCDLVTVYRCLEAFEAASLVQKVTFGDGTVRYEFSSDGHHHHHLICTRCKKVETLGHEICPQKVVEKIAQLKKFTQVRHTLEVFGLCPECQS